MADAVSPDTTTTTTETPTIPAAPASPAPAAPAAPVAQPAPTVTSPEDTTTPEAPSDEGAEAAYDPTGDPALDVALGFMGKLGLGRDHPAIAAATMGDFNLLKATLSVMGDKAKGWEQMVQLGEQAYARAAADAETKANAVKDAVHNIAGGEAQWKSIKDWAAANATPEEKAELNTLFDSGLIGARAAAQLLVGLYNKATGTVVNPASALRPGTSSAAPAANSPLSPRDYAAAVRDLYAQLGNRMDASPEYRALKQRLAAYRG